MALGPKSGAAIKLNADAYVANHLTIGDCIETTLAGMTLGYSPAWAVDDAGELAHFPVLDGVASLTILVTTRPGPANARRWHARSGGPTAAVRYFGWSRGDPGVT